MDATEAIRRKSNVVKLREFFLLHPMEWINAVELEPVAGRQAWRTRVSQLRKALHEEGAGTIENRQKRATTLERENGEVVRMYLGSAVISEYRFLPYRPLGRAGEEQIQSLPLFDDGPWSHR